MRAGTNDKAAFDGLLHTVETTEEILREALFGARPAAFVLIGELDREPAGFALCFLTFSSFLGRAGIWLDDLFVDEAARGHGVGSALLESLGERAVENGYARIEWMAGAENADGLAFYQRHGARVHAAVRVLRLDGAAIVELARQKTA